MAEKVKLEHGCANKTDLQNQKYHTDLRKNKEYVSPASKNKNKRINLGLIYFYQPNLTSDELVNYWQGVSLPAI